VVGHFGREGPYQHLSGDSHDAAAAAIAASTLNHPTAASDVAPEGTSVSVSGCAATIHRATSVRSSVDADEAPVG
jgi:hypothetical protein